MNEGPSEIIVVEKSALKTGAESAEARHVGEILRHELNNPLTGILGNAELLLVELQRKHILLPQSAVTRLETIASLALRMRETIRRLSEESRIEADGTSLAATNDLLGGVG